MTVGRYPSQHEPGSPGGGSVTTVHRIHASPSGGHPLSLVAPAPAAWTNRMLAVLRIVAGAIFVSAGTMKLFGYPPSPVPLPPIHLTSQLGVAALLEIVGGLAIVLGLFTRPVAFVLAGEMAVAYFEMHFPQSFFPTTNGGMPAVLYCFIYLYLSFAGAGAWSIDGLRTRARNTAGVRPHTGG